ncbi:epidermal growth factor receptor-like [Patella vulgata]|uniref:epidermal growth factor receptor-like n=1 Tax=Patella vulgata TaxID=6465 RepID=UPI0024A7CA6C|nr:epidermal growth factor receptor-like [Patella vulgata]
MFWCFNFRDPHLKIPHIHPSNLSVFEDVEEISGNLIIQSNHTEFRNLSYFKSLKYFSGREPNGALALNIMMTHLESLELVKLKEIRQGGILIAGNSNLCYVGSMNWRLLILNDDQRLNIQSNAKPEDCVRDGHVYDDECSLDGCWGKGKDKCLKCRKYRVEEENMCIKSCSHINLHLHAGNKRCKPCHAQCKNNCTGPEPNQ